MIKKVLFEQLMIKDEYSEKELDVGELILEGVLKADEVHATADNYIQSSIPYGKKGDFLGDCSPELHMRCQSLASYEYHLLKKIAEKNSTFCLIGDPGSGKTTILNYLYNNFIFSNELSHCNRNGCKKNRILLKIDFRNTDWKSFKDSEVARKLLIDKINKLFESQLFRISKDSNKVRYKPPLAIDEDLIDFWDWVIIEIDNTDVTNRPILVDIKALLIANRDKKYDMAFRRKCRDELFKNRYNKLNYLICLCHYVNNVKLNPARVCCQIFFDNIDYADFFIQEELHNIISKRILPYNLNLCIVLRSEKVFNNYQWDTVINYREHKGVTSYRLLLERIKEFRKEYPTSMDLRKKYEFGDMSHADIFLNHLDRLIRILSEREEESVFNYFINHAMKHFLRSMIKSAQFLFWNRLDFISNNHISDHHVLRVFLRNSMDYFVEELRSPICNLFYCRVEYDNFPLIKIRILSYLYGIPDFKENKYAFLNQIVDHLKQFDYPSKAIEQSLTQLVQPSHQLLLSTNKNYVCDLEQKSEDKIYLTETGAIYIEKVMHSLDYIQEMMISCAVEESYFEHLKNDNFATERLNAAIRFLKYLGKTEYTDSINLLNPSSVNHYYNTYGDNLIVYRIYISVGEQLVRIGNSLEKHSDLLNAFEKIMQDYKKNLFELKKLNTTLHSKVNKLMGRAVIPTFEVEVKRLINNIDMLIHTRLSIGKHFLT